MVIRKKRLPPGKNKQVRRVQEEKKMQFSFKLFGKWDSNVQVNDISLKPYINIDSRFMPRSAGRLRKPFHKSKAHIVERLAQHIIVAGHTGKRHRLTSGVHGGHMYNVLKNVESALDIVEKKTTKNPLEVFVRAIENASLREEIISFQVGSVMAREAVITAPQRSVDKTLRFMGQGCYRKSFNKKIKLSQALAEEIINSAEGKESFSSRERDRIEREASGAR